MTELLNLWKAILGVYTAPWFPMLLIGVAVLLGVWRKRGAIWGGVKWAWAKAGGSVSGKVVWRKPTLVECLLVAAVLSMAVQRWGQVVDWLRPDTPVVVTPSVPAPSTVTSVTYVYEKDDTGLPAAVVAGLNRLNRERGIVATPFEQNVKDGTGDTPAQYKLPLAEAQKVGLPALVVLAGDKVLKVVKDPKTDAEVREAAQ